MERVRQLSERFMTVGWFLLWKRTTWYWTHKYKVHKAEGMWFRHSVWALQCVSGGNWFNLHVSTSAGSHRYTCTTAPSTERQTGCRQVQEQHLTTELHSVSAGDGPASWCEVWDSRNESWTFKSTSVVISHAAPKIWADSVNRSILLERRHRSVYSQPEKTLKKQNIAAHMWAWWWHHATSQPNLPTLPVSARRFLFKPFIWSNSR